MASHILIVDDESHIRRIVEVNLVRAGHRVTTAADGVDAQAKIRADRPDLILLDVMMPNMDGFELLRRLKEDPDTAPIPVVMLTAQSKDEDVFTGERLGALQYITKPFSPTELLTAVTDALQPRDSD